MIADRLRNHRHRSAKPGVGDELNLTPLAVHKDL